MIQHTVPKKLSITNINELSIMTSLYEFGNCGTCYIERGQKKIADNYNNIDICMKCLSMKFDINALYFRILAGKLATEELFNNDTCHICDEYEYLCVSIPCCESCLEYCESRKELLQEHTLKLEQQHPKCYDCPVCLELMVEPRVFKECGHSVCGYCESEITNRDKLGFCPTCKLESSTIPNYSMKSILEEIYPEEYKQIQQIQLFESFPWNC